MRLRLQVRSGALIGRTLEFQGGTIRVGRQPGLDVSFDPVEDLAVSALHAEFEESPEGWVLRDLESRNGTWVDGRRIRKPVPIQSGAHIRFGTGGPEVEVVVGEGGGPGATTRVRIAVTRETRKLRGWLALLSVALVAVTGTLLIRGHLNEARWEEERGEILAAADRALGAGGFDRSRWDTADGEEGDGSDDPEPLHAEFEALNAALEEAREEVRALRDALHDAEASRSDPGSEEEALRRRLQDATAALSRRQMAGSLDFPGIREANGRAVALVHVQSASGGVSTGTAFAVRPDGLLVTVRHLVLPDPDGPRPARIGVQFAGSPQVFPGRLVATSNEFDLAAIQMENVAGTVPVVRGFNLRPDTLGTGAPVASLGFPLGGEVRTVEGEDRPIARALLTAGVLSRLSPGTLEIHGYGNVGASGSPIFDAAGQVVGVLYGGRPADPEQVLLAVNSVQVHRFLDQIP